LRLFNITRKLHTWLKYDTCSSGQSNFLQLLYFLTVLSQFFVREGGGGWGGGFTCHILLQSPCRRMHETSTHLSHQQLRVEKKILNYSITEEAVMHDEKRNELVKCHEENRADRLQSTIRN